MHESQQTPISPQKRVNYLYVLQKCGVVQCIHFIQFMRCIQYTRFMRFHFINKGHVSRDDDLFQGIGRPFELRGESRLIRSVMKNWMLG
jgi:hypothetical protein